LNKWSKGSLTVCHDCQADTSAIDAATRAVAAIAIAGLSTAGRGRTRWIVRTTFDVTFT